MDLGGGPQEKGLGAYFSLLNRIVRFWSTFVNMVSIQLMQYFIQIKYIQSCQFQFTGPKTTVDP